MKIRILEIFGLVLLSMVQLVADERVMVRSPEQLDQLFGPVALYPDPLIALILPAATVPGDVVLAARFLEAKGDPMQLDDQSWDDSVKSLARYPDIVRWMDHNLAWTKQAGDAFLAQPTDVMNCIQRLRARARAVGVLRDTPQQQIVVEDEIISITPAQPDVIYIPSYDPDVVYVSRPGYYSDSFMTFGPAFVTGFWLGYGFDWDRHRIWTIDRSERERFWRDRHEWRRPGFPDRPDFGRNGYRDRPWEPSSNNPRPARPPSDRPRSENTRRVPVPNIPGERSPDLKHRIQNDSPSGENRRWVRPEGRELPPSRRPEISPVVPIPPATVSPNVSVIRDANPSQPPPSLSTVPQQSRRVHEEQGPRGYDSRGLPGHAPSDHPAPPPAPPPAQSIPASVNPGRQAPPPPPHAPSQPSRAEPVATPQRSDDKDDHDRRDHQPRS